MREHYGLLLMMDWINIYHDLILLKCIEPCAISVNSIDEQFVQRILKFIEEDISDPTFGVDQFVDKVGMGKTQFYKK